MDGKMGRICLEICIVGGSRVLVGSGKKSRIVRYMKRYGVVEMAMDGDK